MTPPRHLLGTAVGLTLLVAGTATSARSDLEALLARPPSPGSLALLIPHVREPKARERWYESLSHRDPRVRAIAARLLFVAGVRGAATGLVGALETESDEGAGVELARALLRETAAHDGAIVDAAERLRSEHIVLVLARARGTAAIAHLHRLLTVPLSNETREEVVGALVAGQQEALTGVLEASLATSNADAWRTALWTAHRQELDVQPDLIESALRSDSAEIRHLSWWHVAVLAVSGKPVPAAATSAAARLESQNPSTPPEVSFGCELAARALGAPAEVLEPVLDRMRKGEADFTRVPFGRQALSGRLATLLTADERKALDIKPSEPDPEKTRSKPQETRTLGYAVTRTVADLPEGYVADVVRETGCLPETSAPLAGAIAEYGSRGSIRKVSFIAPTLGQECQQAARLIVTADLIPNPRLESPDRELILLPMHKATLECLAAPDQPRTGRLPPVAPVRAITRPEKTHHVAPIYPEAARHGHREGLVVLEATISGNGCVRRVELLRSSSHVDLDASAIDAVSQWRFTPTRLHGDPVPVTMTATVQFTLR